jgi:hypothetical protein
MIRFINNTSDAYGNGISIGGGGVVIVGAGESASNFQSTVSAGAETLYLTSDGGIEFLTYCDTIANRRGVWLDTSRQFYPDTNNVGSIGTSSNKWSNMYATTYNGYNIILQGGTSATVEVGSTVNPRIDFKDSNGSQYLSLVYSDYDSYQAPDSLTLIGNQTGSYFIAPNIKAQTGLYVTGTSKMRMIIPEANNKYTLGASGNGWQKIFVGSADSYGSSTIPIYWDNGVPTACTYSLNAKVNSGTSNTLAYYSGTNEISSYTSPKGSGIKLWYLNAGVPTESSSTVGSSTNPVCLSSGTITKCTYSLGAHVNSATQYGVAYYSTTTNLTSTSAGTSGYLLQGNGSAAPSWIQATNSNTVSTVVKRDSSGNFSAGTITASLSGNASTATKLSTAKNIALSGNLQGSTSFDGSSNITITALNYQANISSNNQSNYPWHRIATVTAGTTTYTDKCSLIRIRHTYNGGGEGLAKISVRTNASGNGCQLGIIWLYRYNIAKDALQGGLYGNTGDNVVADIYYKCGTYARAIVESISNGRVWTLVNSSEVSNTTSSDKLTSYEVYTSVADGGSTIRGVTYTVTTIASDHVSSGTSLANSGTATRIAYYNSSSSISSGSIITDGSYLRNIGGYNNTSYSLSTSSFISESWVRTKGSTGWYSEDYGGGWYMSDSSWIRSYGSKNIYHNSGILRTDGTFQVGESGKYFSASSSSITASVYFRSSAEIQSTSANAFRAVCGNYGVFLRNDGSNTYILLTASGDQYGSWNSLRPLTINNSTGVCNISGNSATTTKLATARSLWGNSFNGTADISGNITISTTAEASLRFNRSDKNTSGGIYLQSTDVGSLGFRASTNNGDWDYLLYLREGYGVILTTKNRGTSLPSSGVNGQIFFKY